MLGCPGTERVEAAMHVGVLVLIIIANRVQDGPRLLRTGSAVEIDQRMAVHAFVQDRKILSDSRPIHLALQRLVHPIICANHGLAPSDSIGGRSTSDAKCLRLEQSPRSQPLDEENRDWLLLVAGKTGARLVLRNRANSAEGVSRA